MLQATGETFTIEYNGEQVMVEVYAVLHALVFKINLPTPLMITRSEDHHNTGHWTSIPEDNAAQAIAIGPLIEQQRTFPDGQTLF